MSCTVGFFFKQKVRALDLIHNDEWGPCYKLFMCGIFVAKPPSTVMYVLRTFVTLQPSIITKRSEKVDFITRIHDPQSNTWIVDSYWYYVLDTNNPSLATWL